MATQFFPTNRLPQVKVMLYTSKTLADGSHPLRLRITKDGDRKYISIGESSPLSYWDVEKEAPRRNHPDQKRLLALIKKWETSYDDAAKQLHEIGHPFTIDMIIDAVTETNRKPVKERRGIMLLSYLKDIYEQLLVAQRVGNANVYRDTRRVLAKYLDDKDCPFVTVNVSFLNRFETYLRSEGCADTTMSVYFRTLRAAVNRAISEKMFPVELYPFSRHSSERDKFSLGKFNLKTRKRAIPKAEIRSIEAVEVTTHRLVRAKNMFLFSYYCAGINYVDMAQLRWQNVRDGRLQYVRQKTGGLLNLRMHNAAQVILEYYRTLPTFQSDGYVFDILDPRLHVTQQQIENRLHKIKGQVNADLKVIGKEAGIDTPLTTYVARHTFATVLRKANVPDAKTSQTMDHSTEKVTRGYLNDFEDAEIDEVFDNL